MKFSPEFNFTHILQPFFLTTLIRQKSTFGQKIAHQINDGEIGSWFTNILQSDF